MLTRRQFIATAGFLTAGLLLPPVRFAHARRQFAQTPLQTRKLRDNVFAILERGGNSLLLQTSEGNVLIDTKITEVADELLDVTTRIGNGAPATVINTHHHPDHVGSNYIFAASSTIIAHRNVKPRMEATLQQAIKPALVQQARTLHASGKIEQAKAVLNRVESLTAADFGPHKEFTDTLSLEWGDISATLHHFGNGHTDNDTVIHFPNLNIIHMGDLLFHGMHPYFDRSAKADSKGWQHSVRRAIELCDDDTIIIPGHGEITNKAALPRQIEYFDQMRETVQQAIDQGKTREQIAELKPEAFADLGFDAFRPIVLTAIYEELTEDAGE